MSRRPKIMGIVNVTPDSFSDGGRFTSLDAARNHAEEMIESGADIIDIGGESTRPGAKPVSVDEELRRVIPVISALSGCGADISIDTRKPEVAKAAIQAGAHIWNDVTALSYQKDGPEMAARLGCKVVLMHMQGTPENMQLAPKYQNVVAEILAYLKGRASLALRAGVKRENIIVDPGIGFGKRLSDNLDILQHLDDFHMLGYPVLLGASRKSFIGAIDKSTSKARLGGSLAAALWGASLGAQIVRVHDVAETAQALNIWQAIREREK
ncbi:MAG TPA: dihydropteroate synthase [Hellea balneolensis]|uniref:Dihydropteroate synthase n=1 Tax=Hellea balneolensis TaxID=287478 RepID=A0A7C5QWH7_9PROT|nr:dihydropteroate synthase [Hellea balneolensis]